jgi:periplasmic protein TonB
MRVKRRVDMPGVMFQDVVSLRTRSHRKWYTLPLSFLVHTAVLAVLVAVPLIATDIPRPREIIEYVTPHMPVIPAAPPSIRRAPRSPIAGNLAVAPVVAPDSIGVESGVIVEPGHVETAGLDGLVGSLEVGQIAVDTPPPVMAAPQPPVVVGGNIRPPVRTKYVMPEYPALARSTKVEGVVIIEALIGVDGRVEQARVLRSKPFLDEAALAAVREWEYTPTLLNGRPTRVIMTVTVNYTLKP